MILSSDELEILGYLKSWKGTPVSMVEICRCAGGRRKFREQPHWAKNLMSRLVEANLVFINDRGHYCAPESKDSDEAELPQPKPAPPVAAKAAAPNGAHTVGENYFPAAEPPPKPAASAVIGGDYFPASDTAESHSEQWISPQMAEILKKSGKKFGHKKHDD